MVNNDALTLRQALVASLKQKGELPEPAMEAAFAEVPRHVFLPDMPLERVYANEAIPIKRDTDGIVLSSSSQPSMMAIMLRQLRLNRGDNVLEIGTGTGYNAAIMQHIVGEEGSVTTVELDKELATQARINLQRVAIGYKVTVVEADGAMGYAPRASYDSIIATAATWDVPPTWVRQLKPDGILVAPMWLEGLQMSAAFSIQADGTLYSPRNIPCGFIPLRGLAAGPNVQIRVRGSALTLTTGASRHIDGVALQSLLSEDAEISHFGTAITPGDYWGGFLTYITLNPPPGYLFTLYSVLDNQTLYGLEGYGFALITSGSACFVPYHENGAAHCFGSADAFLMLSDIVEAWQAAGRPGTSNLRLQLLPKQSAKPIGERSNTHLYPRQYNNLLAWLDS